ncbi:ABC transporter ATP-binding protein [Chelativorans sp. YIM 93263]|uniref:ABC transporter ATP-binding protein n=1 Tax=Chelativorans sp. YIM 93263 TaxID=2906648 RepID=UPI002378FDC0|nr:ABC transporter ATP-binding protein [Chelativorans sp. YIM 93263]
MVKVVIDNVTKKFGDFTAVDCLSTTFEDGAVTCLLGPSGCGKTTLMRMIVGLETPTSGRILFGDKDMGGLPPRKRSVGMVFQYPVMYPTLSVEENIALPLNQDRSIDAAERRRRIDEVLDVLDMRDRGGAFIGELDAGSRQKVAVGRAVARRSDIVLFDEPTTNVEVQAKLALIRAFKLVTSRLKQTIIYVTHDQTEAMTLADHVALMRDGRIIQYDTPQHLYALPATEFAGWFLGNPGMNFVPARREGDGVTSALGGGVYTPERPLDGAAEIKVGVRPEHVRVSARPRPGAVAGRLKDMNVGIAGRSIIRIALEDFEIKAKVDGLDGVRPGDAVYVSADPEWTSVFANGTRVGAEMKEGAEGRSTVDGA